MQELGCKRKYLVLLWFPRHSLDIWAESRTPTARFSRQTQKKYHICEYLALPFVHGQALQPEIRRLQSAFDTCPEELALRVALQELHALEAEQAALGSELLQQPSESGGVGSSASISEASASAVDAVAKLLQGEEQRDAAVHAASFEVKRRAEAGRQSFMERVETGIPRDQ